MEARSWIVWGAAALLVAACSGGDATSTTVTGAGAPPPAGTTTTAPATTSVTVSVTANTTSTSAPSPPASEGFLVTAADGVWQVDMGGAVELLIAGPVAVAVDDTRGGLLYQLASDRWWDDQDDEDTTVWWVPRGEAAAQALIVPTPGSGQRLTLHDAFATAGGFAVLYTRHDGSIPDVDMVDRLKRLDIPGGDVTEIFAHGAFEQGFGEVRSNGTFIAGTEYDQVGSVCFLDDMAGTPTGLVPDIAGDPAQETGVEGCRLSPDGGHLWFFYETHEDNVYQSTTITAWDLTSDREGATLVLGVDRRIGDIDVGASRLVGSRHAPVAGGYGTALVWTLDDLAAAPLELPVPGRARALRATVDTTAPATP